MTVDVVAKKAPLDLGLEAPVVGVVGVIGAGQMGSGIAHVCAHIEGRESMRAFFLAILFLAALVCLNQASAAGGCGPG